MLLPKRNGEGKSKIRSCTRVVEVMQACDFSKKAKNNNKQQGTTRHNKAQQIRWVVKVKIIEHNSL